MLNPKPASPARPVWSRAGWAGLAAIWLVIAAGQVLSLKQAINGDEGFYLAAGRLVSEGKQPYLDFFYPQAPLLPYYLAPFLKIFGTDFLVGRAALLLVTGFLPLLLILIFRELGRERSSGPAAMAGLFFLAAHPWTYSYLILCKGYGLSLTAWLAALWFFLRALSRSGRPRLVQVFAAGFCFSIAANVQAPFLLLGLPLIFGLAWARVPEKGWRGAGQDLLVFALGAVLPALPALVAWLRGPQVFWFNNFGYPSWRYLQLAFFNPQKDLALRGFMKEPLSLFALVCTLLALVSSRSRRVERPGSIMLICIGGSGLLLLGMAYARSPIAAEDFVGLIPFFALMIFLGFADFPGLWPRRVLAAGLLLAALAQGPAWMSQAQSRFGWRINSRSLLAPWRDAEAMNRFDQASYAHVQAVVKALNQWAEPGEAVLSFWPGFIAPSRAAFVPGLENQMGLQAAGRLGRKEMTRFRLADPADIFQDLTAGKYRLLVNGQWDKDFLAKLTSEKQLELFKRLSDAYRSVLQDDQVSVLVRGQAPLGNPVVLPSLGGESFPWVETISLAEQTIPGLYGDRLTVFGYLMQPRHLVKSMPAVMLIHGGFRADSSGWLLPAGGLALKLVQAGYTVLALEQRGSMAHGQAFADLRDLGTAEINDVLSALHFLQNLPGVDSKRVALMGASRGSALALRAAEETDAFRLVVGYSSVVDYRLFYCSHGCAQTAEGRSWCEQLWQSQGEAPPPARPPTEFCGNLDSIARCRPWEPGCRIYGDGSPLLHLERLHTPVLLHHSEDDTAAAFLDVLAFERGLQQFHVPHHLFVYPESDYGPVGHSFLYPTSPYYNEAAAEVAWARTLRALDYYLKDQGFWPW